MHAIALILAAAVAAPQVSAPWLCQDSEAVMVCMDRIANGAQEAAKTQKAQAVSAVNTQVHATPTGAGTSAGTASDRKSVV